MKRYWCAGGCGDYFEAEAHPYSLVVYCTLCGSYKTRPCVDPALRIPYEPAWWEHPYGMPPSATQPSTMMFVDPDWKSTQ